MFRLLSIITVIVISVSLVTLCIYTAEISHLFIACIYNQAQSAKPSVCHKNPSESLYACADVSAYSYSAPIRRHFHHEYAWN